MALLSFAASKNACIFLSLCNEISLILSKRGCENFDEKKEREKRAELPSKRFGYTLPILKEGEGNIHPALSKNHVPRSCGHNGSGTLRS
jgi:hypothetical protein